MDWREGREEKGRETGRGEEGRGLGRGEVGEEEDNLNRRHLGGDAHLIPLPAPPPGPVGTNPHPHLPSAPTDLPQP